MYSPGTLPIDVHGDKDTVGCALEHSEQLSSYLLYHRSMHSFKVMKEVVRADGSARRLGLRSIGVTSNFETYV